MSDPTEKDTTKKSVAKKTTGKKKTAGKKASAKSKPAQEKSEKKEKGPKDIVTLAVLAEEAGITTAKARQKLRAAEIEKPESNRWEWTNKTVLKKVRKALES